MSFPLRLTADLTIALATRALSRRSSHPILQLSADELFLGTSESSAADNPQGGNDPLSLLAGIPQHQSPIIWIGGSEPLDYPGVAPLANSLAASARHVFLETSGASLKTRLHEFQPSSRLYLAIRLNTKGAAHDSVGNHAGIIPVGLEAIRMARLAGFFTCVHLIVRPGTSNAEINELYDRVRPFDVDGFLISPDSLAPELEQVVAPARRRLLGRQCALISSLLDTGALSAAPHNSSKVMEHSRLPESHRDSFGESAGAG
jgi:hypothetical protein